MGKAMWDILRVSAEFELIGCEKNDDINEKAVCADILVLAVKPQMFEELAGSVKVDLSGKLVISIMAGVKIGKIQKLFGVRKVVRALPNLALKVGQSLTIWKASEEVSDEDKTIAKEILGSFGQEIEVDSEEQISLIGVVSGCGPGFLAYFGEKMTEFLAGRGIDRTTAEKVARQTLIGTGEVVRKSDWNLKDMRQKVSSKGGLTEAGINAMEKGKLGEIFAKGAEAALRRDNELSN